MKRLKHHLVVLTLPTSVPALIVRARHVILVMTDNDWFPSPSPSLVTTEEAIDALEAAELVRQQGGKGTAAARNVARKKVEGLLRGLQAHAQRVVWDNADDARAIAESAGMALKQPSSYRKPALEAVAGAGPGQVIVRARAVRRRGVAYEWQRSADGGETWITMGVTTVAYTSIGGLSLGTTHLFRFRTTVKSTTGGWSESVGILVAH